MIRKADLHIHTTASGDALNEPEDVFKMAKEAGLSAVTFTDHDTTLHHQAGRELSKKYGIEFLPGVEVSSSWNGQTAHVLAFFFGPVGFSLQPFLDVRARAAARDTAKWLIKKMQEMGIDVNLQEYEEVAKKCNSGDSPLLRLMIKKGHVRDIFDYKKKFQKLSFEHHTELSPPVSEVVSEIHKAGGLAVLAHPGGRAEYYMYEFKEDDIKKVIDVGIDGLEVYHRWNDDAKRELYLELVRKYSLMATGGSDNHGSEADSDNGNNKIGSYWCDWDIVKGNFGDMRYDTER